MIVLVQRVSKASVTVDHRIVGQIGNGMVAMVGFEPNDCQKLIQNLGRKLLNYRIFADAQGRMNQSLLSTGGELLVIPQFTLAADTRSGLRPSFSTAMPPDQANDLFTAWMSWLNTQLPNVQQGTFGADMQVSLINDGPATFWLQQQ